LLALPEKELTKRIGDPRLGLRWLTGPAFHARRKVVEKDQIAMEELKLLEAIIARQDEFKSRTQNWAVTLVAALTAVYWTGQAHIGPFQFLFIVCALSVAFMFFEAIFGSAESLAEDRVRLVEESLREPRAPKYDGPMICDSMRGKFTLSRAIRSIRYPRTWLLYGSLVAFAFIALMIRW
jgi:uncharacterized membrane protein